MVPRRGPGYALAVAPSPAEAGIVDRLLAGPDAALRWRTLGVYWLVQAAAIFLAAWLWIVVSFEVDGPKGQFYNWPPRFDSWAATLADPVLFPGVPGMLVLLTAMQFLLLSPVARPGPALGGGRRLWNSIAGVLVAVALFMLVLVGIVITAADLLGARLHTIPSTWLVLGLPIAASWAVATPLLAAYMRRGVPEERLARVASWLLRGTALEILAAIPLDIMIRRKTSCYCAQGTYFALGIGVSLAAAVAGPAVLLVAMGRRRAAWRATHCATCGYDRGALPRCPECGAEAAPPVDQATV